MKTIYDTPNLNILLDYLTKPKPKPVLVEGEEIGFNMYEYVNRSGEGLFVEDMTGRGCGTVCCMAGFLYTIRYGHLPKGVYTTT